MAFVLFFQEYKATATNSKSKDHKKIYINQPSTDRRCQNATAKQSSLNIINNWY